MTQGIKEFAKSQFLALLPKRAEIGNTAFRKTVMDKTMAKFQCTLAAAATHYNEVFKAVKAEAPETVEGLGRAEDKKGGRKPIHIMEVVKARSGALVATGLSAAKAEAMVDAAAAAHKVKLVARPVAEPAAPVAEPAAPVAEVATPVAEPAAPVAAKAARSRKAVAA